MSVHPSAIIHEGARLGADVKIGPFCIVGPDAALGDRVELKSNVIIEGKTEIGDDTVVYPFAVLGVMSQDLKWQDAAAMTGLRIGKCTRIREYVTVHSGTPASTGTEIGDDCQIMVAAHVAHDCKIASNVVLSNLVQIAGHVEIEDNAIVSACSAVHQFCRIGRNAFIGGMSGIGMDVPPYSIFDGRPGVYRTVNKVGLLRHGFTNEDLHAIHRVYSLIFGKEGEGSVADNLKKLRREKEISGNKYAMDAIDFIENRSKRGVAEMRVLK